VLDHNRRKPVAAVGDFSHPTTLTRNLAPNPDRYPDNTGGKHGKRVEFPEQTCTPHRLRPK
jgi:hypothetical protein